MKAYVEWNGGNPSVVVDQRPIPEMAYITYRPEENRYDSFADAGVKLYSVNLNFSEMPINERAPVLVFQKGIFEGETPDFSIVDRNFGEILSACPDAYIFPRVNVNLPRAWEEAHPDELCEKGFGDRTRFSYASDLWIQEVKDKLRQLIRYIEDQPYADRVIGYQLAAGNTEEWLAIDPQSGFGLRAKEKFLAYCERTGEGKNEGSYYRFMSELVASRIVDLAALVKELTSRRKLVGFFYGYTMYVKRNQCHNALKTVLSCDDVDFLCSPLCYADLRVPGIDLYPMIPVASVRHHGKVYFSENDLRTHLSRAIHSHPNYTSPIWFGPEPSLATEQLKLGFCRAMLHGYGMWWFDMWGGWYDDPRYMDLMKRMAELCEGGMDVPDSEIAVYVDESAMTETDDTHLPDAMRALGLCGVSYDAYLASDFEDTFRNYRACILVEPVATSLSDACAARSAEASVPLLRIQSNDVTAESLRGWLTSVGVAPSVSRRAVVYRGKKYLTLYTAEEGEYDFCDGERHTFVDLFSGETVSFPAELPKGKFYLFERMNVEVRPSEKKD